MRVGPIVTFDGRRTATTSLAFLNQVKSFALCQDLPADQWPRLAAQCMTGPAREWMKLVGVRDMSWVQFSDAFKKKWVEPGHDVDRWVVFHCLRQRSTVGRYMREFLDMVLELNLDENDAALVEKFYIGLRSDIQVACFPEYERLKEGDQILLYEMATVADGAEALLRRTRAKEMSKTISLRPQLKRMNRSVVTFE